MNGTGLGEIIDRVGIMYALIMIIILLMYIAFYRQPRTNTVRSQGKD